VEPFIFGVRLICVSKMNEIHTNKTEEAMKRILSLILMMTLLTNVNVAAEEGSGERDNSKVDMPEIQLTSISPDEVSVDEASIDGVTAEALTNDMDYTMDNGMIPTLYGMRNNAFIDCRVLAGDQEITYDVGAMVVDGIVYLPLRYTLEALGFQVTWKAQTRSIEMMKGPRYTSVTLDKNAYFKNKMAPVELSGAPFAVEGRTMVPLEFFYLMLNEAFVIDANTIVFNGDMMGTYSGYIQSIEYDETGNAKITISSLEVSEDMMDLTIIHTNANFTVFQKDIEEGSFINVLIAPVMAMSIPGQTAGYLIY